MRVELEPLYRKTLYRVQAGHTSVGFTIDQYDPLAENRLIDACGTFGHWAIITPCNPGSVALCEHENLARLENLQRLLKDSPYRWLTSSNHDPDNAWPDEPGALILDIAISDAQALARQFGQKAFISAMLGQPPQLRWLECS